jgi:Xaa-Pro dipeptidase
MGSARDGGDLAMASPLSTLSPPVVPIDLHVSNRKKLLDSVRDHLSASSRPSDGFVLLQVIKF